MDSDRRVGEHGHAEEQMAHALGEFDDIDASGERRAVCAICAAASVRLFGVARITIMRSSGGPSRRIRRLFLLMGGIHQSERIWT